MRVHKFVLSLFFLLASMGCGSAPKDESPFLPTPHQQYEKVEFESLDHKKIEGYLFKPTQGFDLVNRLPAVVALHGCSGLLNSKGEMNARDLDWGTRLAEKGYWVLYPDSFATRGLKEICTRKDLRNFPRVIRVKDALGALKWFQDHAGVDSSKVVIIGWSNGGSTTLWTLGEKKAKGFKMGIAFYPGCGKVVKAKNFKLHAPLEILMGALDNWTGSESCVKLTQKFNKSDVNAQITLYKDAHHGFDQPQMPLHERTGLANTVDGSGRAWVGTHEESRKQSIQKVNEILEQAFKVE